MVLEHTKIYRVKKQGYGIELLSSSVNARRRIFGTRMFCLRGLRYPSSSDGTSCFASRATWSGIKFREIVKLVACLQKMELHAGGLSALERRLLLSPSSKRHRQFSRWTCKVHTLPQSLLARCISCQRMMYIIPT
jgi:hypothetical protein